MLLSEAGRIAGTMPADAADTPPHLAEVGHPPNVANHAPPGTVGALSGL